MFYKKSLVIMTLGLSVVGCANEDKPNSSTDTDSAVDTDIDTAVDTDTDTAVDTDTNTDTGSDIDECNQPDWFSIADDYSLFLSGLEEGVDYLNAAEFVQTADGLTNNTQSFMDALSAMNSQGIDKLFIPAGHYKIDALLLDMEEVKWYGSSVGISLIAATNGQVEIGNGFDSAKPKQHLSPYGLYFYNVLLESSASSNCENGAITYKNNVFIATENGRVIRDKFSCESIIEGNVFLGSVVDTGQTMNFKQTSMNIKDNVFGLDLEATNWLETEWSRFNDWICLDDKLAVLETTLSLPQMMDTFHCLANIGGIREEGQPIIIHGNIVNASSELGASSTDHIFYMKGVQDIHIIANYFRGFYDDYTKFSGARDAIVAFNNYDGPEHRSYIEECIDKGPGKKGNFLEHNIFYGNRLGTTPYSSSSEGRLYTWNYCFEPGEVCGCPEGADRIDEENIQYSMNRQSNDISEGIFLKPTDSYSPGHLIYNDNLLEDESGPMTLNEAASYLPEDQMFDASLLGTWAGETVPMPQLPPH